MFRKISHDSISHTFSFLNLNDINKVKQVSKEMKKIIENRSYLIKNAAKNELLESYPDLDKAFAVVGMYEYKREVDWIDVYKNKSNPVLINLIQDYWNSIHSSYIK
jgi:hypothetical protein|tara:strand:- start:24228 stop:24545 length:318 start_codon:yes stop_codon:yes gene_type:complete